MTTLSTPGVEIKKLPTTSGIYIFKKDETILYIGKSVNIKARVLSHIENAKIDTKENLIVSQSNKIEYVVTDSEFKALILEAQLIQKFLPKYNVIWKDNKSYLYVKITTQESYPKISLVRKTDITPDRNYYCGPFSSVANIEEILRYIRRIFPYCTQKKISSHPCFYSKIKLCNPCPNIIEKQEKSKKTKLKKIYRKNIRLIINLFNGKSDIVSKNLHQELKMLAKLKNYEEAIIVRDKIERFNRLLQQSLSLSLNEFNQSEKSQTELIKILVKFFSQLNSVSRIECFDISNLSQKEATASMVVFTNGLSDRSQYRRFKIKSLRLQSDFEMLDEVLKRRLNNKNWPLPDLFVVDGGKPQVRVFWKILAQNKLKVPIIGIAKNPDRLIIGIPDLPMLRPAFNNLGFNLVRAIRDEAHRFAKKYHLFLRNKNILPN